MAKKIDIMLDELFNLFLKKGYNVSVEKEELLFDVLIGNENVKLIVSLPDDYPYTFLSVSLANKDQLSFKLPHMIIGNLLCLYDLDNDRHDYKNYLEEAEETLERAQKLLLDSQKGILDTEYENEFYDLWTVKEISPIYSMLNGYESRSSLIIIQGDGKDINGKSTFVVSDKKISDNSLINLLDNLSMSNIKISGEATYIPIKKSKLSHPIERISDLWNLICKENLANYFLKDVIDKKIELIILGISNRKSSIPTLVALSLPKLIRPKGKITKVTSYQSIFKANGSKLISRYGLTDVSQDRLITRGGEGIKDHKINTYIVGCGSLGGFLSKALCDTGQIEEMTIQDNQLLKSENIGRHLCGIDNVLESKADAVAKKINSHYPNLKISSLHHSFIQELLGKKLTFDNNNFDLLIITTGDENIEEETINRIKSGIIKSPVIIAWVEPLLVAGHFIYINSPINMKTEEYIFDSEKNIKLGVIDNSESYIKAEVGCQSHFVPYSGFEMQMFSQVIVDQIVNKNLLQKNGNFHFTWFGKIREARKNNISIKKQWRHKNDRELLITRIDE